MTYGHANLPQKITNGLSLWGTLDNPTFPPFLTDNPLPNGYPWGYRNKYSDPNDIPHTGVTRYYNFTIARGKASPDGFEKDVLLINGQFPGPLIEANWGDIIKVTVNNQIFNPEEGTSMHWHGFLQKETPWYDGVPSVGQCPIAPGASFTYRFRADNYGSTWYHAHYSAQYSGGILGPMIIHGPNHVDYDYDLGPVMTGDWYHRDYLSVVKDAATTSNDFSVYVPASDNILINGKNNFNCSLAPNNTKCSPNAGLSKFRFHTGKTHRLRLVNSGAAALVRFSIDGHSLTVIANDFVPVVPYETDVVVLGVGQRTDVVVKATGKPTDTYWMRSTTGFNCTRSLAKEALAIIYYDKADESATPNTTSHTIPDNHCGNDALERTVPFYPMTPNPNPDTTEIIELDLATNATGHHIWIQNGQTYRANYNNPLLLLANQKNYTFQPDWSVYNFGSNKTIRIVINNKYQSAHPMHLHGHNMYVLSEGQGYWDGKTIINPQNPQRRDTQMLRRYGHIVIQIDADNPGVWPFHCHIAWHMSMGLSINIMERPDEINQMQIPLVMEQTCRDWEAYSRANVVDQIDAGI